MHKIIVAALYKFVELKDYQQLQQQLLQMGDELHLRGTLIIGPEGINGTISGSEQAITAFSEWFRAEPRFAGAQYKQSWAAKHPFYRFKILIKKEIVTLGMPEVSPNSKTGVHVDAATWNQLLDDEEVTVIDVRNDYETGIGKFKNAIDPNTKTFREFPEFVEKNLDPHKNKKIAMYCTGGIRCEKASAYMLQQGFEEVYQLDGGVLKYLEEVPQQQSKWQGDCFVFDQRVAVGTGLELSDYELCYGCRMPLSDEHKQHPQYEFGVCCEHCHDNLTEEKKRSNRERHKQVLLARARGKEHFATQ